MLYGYKFDPHKEAQRIIEWIRSWFESNSGNAKGIVIGMSGGKDSTIAAALCSKAIGAENVIGVLMPDIIRNEHDVLNPVQPSDYGTDEKDAVKACVECGITNILMQPIGNTVVQIVNNLLCYEELVSPEITSNIKARIRMVNLYAIAQSKHYRVCCTSNASEIYLGYSTKYGDMAGDFAPLSHLTKSQVVEVGRALGLLDCLVDKTPSDGLTDKSDEEAFGFTYDELDLYLTTGRCKSDKVKELIEKRHNYNLHKNMPMSSL